MCAGAKSLVVSAFLKRMLCLVLVAGTSGRRLPWTWSPRPATGLATTASGAHAAAAPRPPPGRIQAQPRVARARGSNGVVAQQFTFPSGAATETAETALAEAVARQRNPTVVLPTFLRSLAQSLLEPRQQSAERLNENNEYKLNLAEAMDTLNADIPEVFRKEPHWGIFTDDLELDVEMIGVEAIRLLGAAGIGAFQSRPKVKGLVANTQVWRGLHEFWKSFVRHDKVTVRSRLVGIGNEVFIECRWNAQLHMNPYLHWMATMFAKMVYPYNRWRDQVIIHIDAVSRFYPNTKGRVKRHVVESVRIDYNDEVLKTLSPEALLREVGVTNPAVVPTPNLR